jgi:hypothetical protein
MIVLDDLNNDEENFNWWLTIMPDALLYLNTLPKPIRLKLNYSLESLDVLEKYLVENFEIEEMKLPEKKIVIDLFARYIGETFRKNLTNIVWKMETKLGWFGYGFPILTKKDNKPFTNVRPDAILFGPLERKSENFLSNILRHKIENEIKWEGRNSVKE